MTTSTNDIHWLAGILEGEGCFVGKEYYGHPRQRVMRVFHIALHMTDLDIVQRVHRIMKLRTTISRWVPSPSAKVKSAKPSYRMVVCSRRAAEWMMTLYPLLGKRRQGAVRNALAVWRQMRKGTTRKPKMSELSIPNFVNQR